MRRFLIERDLPGAGKLTAEQLKAISATSCAVIDALGPRIEWEHSYVSADRITCIYKAADEQILREHAERGGFPITRVIELTSEISPATASS